MGFMENNVRMKWLYNLLSNNIILTSSRITTLHIDANLILPVAKVEGI